MDETYTSDTKTLLKTKNNANVYGLLVYVWEVDNSYLQLIDLFLVYFLSFEIITKLAGCEKEKEGVERDIKKDNERERRKSCLSLLCQSVSTSRVAVRNTLGGRPATKLNVSVKGTAKNRKNGCSKRHRRKKQRNKEDMMKRKKEVKKIEDESYIEGKKEKKNENDSELVEMK